MQIEKVRISDLNPAEYNPRVRLRPGDAEYEKLKRSIQTFGYIDPIIINADGTIMGETEEEAEEEDPGKAKKGIFIFLYC